MKLTVRDFAKFVDLDMICIFHFEGRVCRCNSYLIPIELYNYEIVQVEVDGITLSITLERN